MPNSQNGRKNPESSTFKDGVITTLILLGLLLVLSCCQPIASQGHQGSEERYKGYQGHHQGEQPSKPTKPSRDVYATLGLGRSAKKSDIKQAYRSLAAMYHPDKTTGDEEKFRKITEARDVLLEYRGKYFKD